MSGRTALWMSCRATGRCLVDASVPPGRLPLSPDVPPTPEAHAGERIGTGSPPTGRSPPALASDFPIPLRARRSFVTNPSFDGRNVCTVADEQGVAPGIVVGRPRQGGLLPWVSCPNRLEARSGWGDEQLVPKVRDARVADAEPADAGIGIAPAFRCPVPVRDFLIASCGADHSRPAARCRTESA